MAKKLKKTDGWMAEQIVMPGYPSLPSFSVPRSAYVDLLVRENGLSFEQAIKASCWVKRA